MVSKKNGNLKIKFVNIISIVVLVSKLSMSGFRCRAPRDCSLLAGSRGNTPGGGSVISRQNGLYSPSDILMM